MGDLIRRSNKKMNSTWNKSTHFLKAESKEKNETCLYISDTKNCSLNVTNNKCSNNIQNLYDVTNIKNGSSIDEIASLLSSLKNLKIISDNIFADKCKNFSNHLSSFGFKVFSYRFEDNPDLNSEDSILIVTEDADNEKYKCILKDKKKYNGKIISVLPEKDKIKKNKSDFVVYFLESTYFDNTICVDVILNCIGISLLVKLGNN